MGYGAPAHRTTGPSVDLALRDMNRPFSVYLDLVRFGAACLVYLYHSNMRLLVTDILPASQYGHSAVIVFFVLSGFVIAYVTDTKEKAWIDYTASRVSRVYSVVVPTLVLTLLLDAAGRAMYPSLYDYPFDRFAQRLVGSALLLNEAWFVSITYFSNVPYWSIAFEFWYYVLFGLVMFLPTGIRAWIAAGFGLVLGPKILLLLPVWRSGVLLYRWHWLQDRSKAFSWCLVVLSTVGIVITHRYGVYDLWSERVQQLLGAERFRELTFARFFVGDYLLCLLVFCNFAGMRGVADSFAPMLLRIERPVRFIAGYTFTLYLLHHPLFLFWTSVIRGNPDSHAFWWTVTLLTAISVGIVGHFTESKRHHLRAAVKRLLQRLSLRWAPRGTLPVPPA